MPAPSTPRPANPSVPEGATAPAWGSAPAYPQGDPFELVLGAHRALVGTTGATLLGYAVGGQAVLHDFGDEGAALRAGQGHVLMPWPNRVADGRYEFDGTLHQLPIDEPELGHAIHGLVRFEEWTIAHRAPEEAHFVHRLDRRPGYPFDLELRVEYRLTPAGLDVTYAAKNPGPTPCPFGAGAHPYFGFSGLRTDTLALMVPADEWLEVDARLVPKRRRPVLDTEFDFRRPKALGAAIVDHAFFRLLRDAEGRAWAVLRHGSDEIRLWQDEAFPFLHVYTSDTLPDTAQRRHSVALEPMTCAPDAFNGGDGLRVLGPGESFRGRWGIVTSYASYATHANNASS